MLRALVVATLISFPTLTDRGQPLGHGSASASRSESSGPLTAHHPIAVTYCETWIRIMQAQSDPNDWTKADIVVEWGEYPPEDYVGGCTSLGAPSGSTFSFTVNGVNRTSYFSISGTTATGNDVPVLSGSNTLEASIQGHDIEGNSVTNTDTRPTPILTLVVPVANGPNGRAFVRSRTPLVLATYSTVGSLIDSASVQLKIRGVDVTALARLNRSLAEWEVDSLRQLVPGDTADIAIKACDAYGICSAVIRRTVLDGTGNPIVSFAGMPLEAHGRRFGAPFGLGIGLSGAEVETGFSVPSYVSMNVPRSTGLVYSTRQSYPRALVNADIELTWPSAPTVPDQIKTVLLDGVVRMDSLVVSSPACITSSNRRCRVTLQGDFSGTTYSRAARKWLKVEVTVTYGGSSKTSVDSTEVVLVDRRSSVYGSGWFVGGVLRLDSAGNDMVLVGSTGATSVYRGSGGSSAIYLSPPGDFSVLLRSSPNYWELRFRDGSKLTFDSQGRQTGAVDRNGNTTTVKYTAVDRVDTIIDPVGKKLSFAYDGNGRLSTITDPGSRQSRVTISGTTNQLTYDSIASPGSNSMIATYSYTTYGGSNTLVLASRSDALGQATTVSYNGRRRPTQVSLPAVLPETGSTPVSPVIGYGAQELRGLDTLIMADSGYVRLTDPRGNWTRSALNRWGQAIRTWDALGTVSRASYTAEGFVAWAEGKVADSTRVYSTYDALGRLVRTFRRRTAGDTVRLDSLVYDANHRVITSVNPLGRATQFSYDTPGNLIRVITPTNDTTRYWYRSNGLMDSTRAPGQTASTRFKYNNTWSNRDTVTNAQGTVVARNGFDSWGRTVESQRRIAVQVSGSTTTYQWRRSLVGYDAANRRDSVRLERTDNCTPCTSPPAWPSSTDTIRVQQVRWRFNRLSLDTNRVNTRGKVMRVSYDALGRVRTRRPYAESTAVVDSFRYDLAGNLRYHWSRRGQLIERHPDRRNRDSVMVVPGLGTYQWTYGGPNDELSRLAIANYVDSIGGVNPAVSWTYSQAGLVLTDTSQGSRVVSRAYDRYGRDTLLADVTGSSRLRHHGVRGALDTVVTPFGDTLSSNIDSWGRYTGPQVANGSAPSFSYVRTWDQTGKLNTVSSWQGQTNLGNWAVEMEIKDALLHPVFTEIRGSGGPTVVMRDTMVHDAWERVTRVFYLRDGNLIAADTFSFDRDGNIFVGSESRSYDATTTRLVSRAGNTYTYDRAGNEIEGPVPTSMNACFSYDALDRLVSVRKKVSGACGPLAARYAYDVLGRRIVKRVYGTYGGLGPVYLRMIYRGGQVVAETDSVGTSLSLAYTWGFGADDLVAIHRYSDSGHWYVVQDNLRSVRGLTTRSGTWAASWRYRIYGAVLDSAGTPPSFTLRYRWIGREYDAETGLYYVRARYYDLASQRFTQEDPIGYAGGSNLYAYGSGNPTTGRDLSGLAMYVGLYEPVWSDHLPVECPIFADCWSGSGGSRRTWMDDVNDHWALIHLQMELQETDYDAYLKKAKGNLEIIGGDPSEVMSRAEFDRAKRAIQNVVNDGRVQDVSVAGVLGFLAGGAVLVDHLGTRGTSCCAGGSEPGVSALWSVGVRQLRLAFFSPALFGRSLGFIASAFVHEFLHHVRTDWQLGRQAHCRVYVDTYRATGYLWLSPWSSCRVGP